MNRAPNTSTQVSVAASNASTARRDRRQLRSWPLTQLQTYPTIGRRISTDNPNTVAQISDVQIPSRK